MTIKEAGDELETLANRFHVLAEYLKNEGNADSLKSELIALHDNYNALQEKFSMVVKELDMAKAKLQALEDIHRKTAAIMGGQLL